MTVVAARAKPLLLRPRPAGGFPPAFLSPRFSPPGFAFDSSAATDRTLIDPNGAGISTKKPAIYPVRSDAGVSFKPCISDSWTLRLAHMVGTSADFITALRPRTDFVREDRGLFPLAS